jgi:hypothetical protein
MNRRYRSYGTLEVRKRLSNLSLAKPRQNIEEILKNCGAAFEKCK